MKNNVVKKTTQKGPKNIITAEVFWLAFYVGQKAIFLSNNTSFFIKFTVHFGY